MKITDLSLPLVHGMRGVSITEARNLEKDGWNATTLSLYSHAGTHMDAPRHFVPGGVGLDGQDLSPGVGPATVIDLTPTAPRELIGIEPIREAVGDLRPGARLLLRTDWHQLHGTDRYRDELPRISAELASWLVEKRVALLGVEPPSVADVNDLDELTEVHRLLFEGGVVIVEGLAHLDRLSSTEVTFIALPLNVPGGDGSPVRAIAIEDA